MSKKPPEGSAPVPCKYCDGKPQDYRIACTCDEEREDGCADCSVECPWCDGFGIVYPKIDNPGPHWLTKYIRH
jgi:hypothetical protein